MAKVHLSPDNGYVCEVSETTSLIVNEESHEKSEGKIGLFSSISMALTMMTGVGVFVYPNMVLKEVQSGGGALVVWGVAGLLSLLAALTYSELALAIPGSGGDFNYLQAGYGPCIANLFLLTAAFVKYPAITVILAKSCVEYFIGMVGVKDEGYALVHCSIIGVIVVAAVITALSTKTATWLVNALNSFKLVGLGSIIVIAVIIFTKEPNKGEIIERFNFNNTSGDIRDIVVGMFGAIASYEGWNSLNIVAGEIDTPHRTLPVAISVATLLTCFIYIVCNIAYLVVIPTQVLMESNAVALDFGRIAFGKAGEIFLTSCVVFSAAASVLALSLCNSRLIAQASTQGQLPSMFGLVHKRFNTPIFAVILHAIIAIIFSCIDSISSLTVIVVFISWFFYLLCFIALMLFRFRDKIRTAFKVPVVIPVFMVLVSMVLLISPGTCNGEYRLSFIGSIIMILCLVPIAVIVGRDLLPKNNVFSRASTRITFALQRGLQVE